MPYDLIRVAPKHYSVINSDTGVVHAKHSLLKDAKAQIRLLNAVKQGFIPKRKGGALKGKEVDQFVKASYEDKKGSTKNIGDYKLDKSLSNAKAKVYHDPKTGKTVVANRGTKGTISDWSNNAMYAIGLYNKTNRAKQAEATQKKVNAKYGKENVTNVGHSQSGETIRELNKKGLVNQSIVVNPASKHEKVRKNETVIRSSGDIVSALVPKGKNVHTIKAKSWNPLTEHSSSIITGKDAERSYGKGKKVPQGQISIGLVPNRVMVGTNPSTYTPRTVGGCMGCMGMCGGAMPTIYDNSLPLDFPKRYL